LKGIIELKNLVQRRLPEAMRRKCKNYKLLEEDEKVRSAEVEVYSVLKMLKKL
jgi:hypothetical protein